MLRRLVLAVAVAAAAAGAVLVGTGGPGALLERVVRAGLGAAGVPVRSLGPVTLGRRGLELRDLAVGAPEAPQPDLEIRHLRLEPSLRGLLRRDLGRLAVEGLRVRGRVDASGAHFGSLDPLLYGEGSSDASAPAVLALVGRVEDGELLLETPAEPVVAPFRSDFRRAPDGRAVARIEFSYEHALGAGTGRIEAARLPSGGLAARAALRGPGGMLAGMELRRPPPRTGDGTGAAGGSGSPEERALAWIGFDGGRVPDAIAGALGLSELRLGPGWIHLRGGRVPGGALRASGVAAILVEHLRTPAGGAARAVAVGLAGTFDPDGGPGGSPPSGAPARLRIGAAGDEAEAGGVALRRLRAEAHVGIALAEGRGLPRALRLLEPARISAAGVRAAGRLQTTRPLAVTVRPGAGPLLTLGTGPGGTIRWTSTWRTDPVELGLDPGSAVAGPTGPLRGRLPGLEAELTGEGGGLVRGRIRGSGGALRAEGLGVRAEGLGLAVEIPEAGGVVEARLSAATVRDLRPARRFGPVAGRVDLRLEPDPAGKVAFHGRIDGRGHPLRTEVRGWHRLRDGRGTATVRIGPLQFREEGAGPAAILPPLAAAIARARGGLEARAELAWSAGSGLAGRGEIALEDLDLIGPAGEVEGLEGRVVLASLLPPVTPPGQEVRAASATVGGLRLGAPRIRFELQRDRRVVLEAFEAGLGGGQLASAGVVDLESPEPRLVLNVRNLDLEQLLDELGIDAVELTGTVIGALPLVLRKGELWIEQGELHALPPGGVLRYRVGGGLGPITGPASGTELARAALENLHYETLRILVDGPVTGELRIRLEVQGRNPDVYGGTAFKVGLNLSGRFLDLIHAGTTGYRLRDQLERKLEVR